MMQINKRKNTDHVVATTETKYELKKMQRSIDELEIENKTLRTKLAECVHELQVLTKTNEQLNKEVKMASRQENVSSSDIENELLMAQQTIAQLEDHQELAKLHLEAKNRLEQANRKLIEENLLLRVDAQRNKSGTKQESLTRDNEINRLGMIIATKEEEITSLEHELNERIRKQTEDSGLINEKIAQLVSNKTNDIQEKLTKKEQKIRSLENQLNQHYGQAYVEKGEGASQSKEDIAQVMLEAKEIANQLIMRANFDIKKSREKFDRELMAYQDNIVFLKEKIFGLEAETRYLLEALLLKTEGLAMIDQETASARR